MFRVEVVNNIKNQVVLTMDLGFADYHWFLKEAFDHGYIIEKVGGFCVRLEERERVGGYRFFVREQDFFNKDYVNNYWDFDACESRLMPIFCGMEDA